MKITIDTKEDSHEEIRKVIRLLSHLIGMGEGAQPNNIFSNEPSIGQSQNSASGSALGDFFANNAAKKEGNGGDDDDDDDEPKEPPTIEIY